MFECIVDVEVVVVEDGMCYEVIGVVGNCIFVEVDVVEDVVMYGLVIIGVVVQVVVFGIECGGIFGYYVGEGMVEVWCGFGLIVMIQLCVGFEYLYYLMLLQCLYQIGRLVWIVEQDVVIDLGDEVVVCRQLGCVEIEQFFFLLQQGFGVDLDYVQVGWQVEGCIVEGIFYGQVGDVGFLYVLYEQVVIVLLVGVVDWIEIGGDDEQFGYGVVFLLLLWFIDVDVLVVQIVFIVGKFVGRLGCC